MTTGSPAKINTAPQRALAARMRELAQRYSLSEIARRTGSSRNNVSRYARGFKAPLEFGCALVDALGVNPAWLLSGEGSPWLAEGAVRNSAMAGNLLELVEAMNAVAKMRLGALAGKHHLKVLRELNEAMQSYERLREKLDAHTRPIFSDLLKQYTGAIEKRDLDSAEGLHRALSQVQRLSEDARLKLEFLEAQAHHAYERQEPRLSTTLLHSLLYQSIAERNLTPHILCERAHNLAMALRAEFRDEEARRTCEAALALAGPEGLDTPGGRLLDGLCGMLLVELGKVGEGLARLQRHIAARTEVYHGESSGLLVRALLLAGVVTFEMACALGSESQSRSMRLLTFANWLEQPAPLRYALKHTVGKGLHRVAEGSMAARYARMLEATLEKSVAAPALRFIEQELLAARSGRSYFGAAAAATSLCWHAGERKVAAKYLQRAAEERLKAPPEQNPDILLVAAYHRNVLRLADDEKLKQESLRFFREKIQCGYGFLSLDATVAAQTFGPKQPIENPKSKIQN